MIALRTVDIVCEASHMAEPHIRRVPPEGSQSEPDPVAPLLAATANGDRAAFADLYRQTSHRLLGIACRMLGDRELAEEVLQEAFLTIWQKAELYKPDAGHGMAWLTTLVRHRAIDRLRLVGGTREVAVGASAELEPYSAGQTTTENSIVVSQSIERCMEGLKSKQRTMIALAFYYGLTHEELSQRTDTPLGTVKSDLRRGLADLRSCLER